jgi:hypothetical protein
MGEKLQGMVDEAMTRGNGEEAKVEGFFDVFKIKESYKEYIESRPYFSPS